MFGVLLGCEGAWLWLLGEERLQAQLHPQEAEAGAARAFEAIERRGVTSERSEELGAVAQRPRGWCVGPAERIGPLFWMLRS